jgi:hypothetical protein
VEYQFYITLSRRTMPASVTRHRSGYFWTWNMACKSNIFNVPTISSYFIPLTLCQQLRDTFRHDDAAMTPFRFTVCLPLLRWFCQLFCKRFSSEGVRSGIAADHDVWIITPSNDIVCRCACIRKHCVFHLSCTSVTSAGLE